MAKLASISSKAAILAAAVALAACATGSTTVLAPAQLTPSATYATVRIEPIADTVKITGDGRAVFDRRLKEYLFAKDSGFTPGDALTIRYRFVAFDEGDQFQRWLAPYAAGKGTMKVEAVFLDTQQTELSKINVDAELSMGPLGGDFDSAISRAARELADYAIKTF